MPRYMAHPLRTCAALLATGVALIAAGRALQP